MSATTPQSTSARGRGGLMRAVRRLLRLSQRVYAVALAALVLWLSYLAFAYLVRSLLLPPRVPPQIVEIPTRLGRRQLSEPPGALAGTEVVPNIRSPLAHFHRITGWPRPDRVNTCTTAGCHAPMPHGKRKEVRAFLNMHATALHCGVCHLPAETKPLPLVWYDPDTGRPAEPPALLRAYAWISSRQVRQQTRFSEQEQRNIVALLREAAAGVGGEPVLEELARHLAAVRPDSEQFRSILQTTRSELPHHFRAEYDAKLALRGADGRPVLGFAAPQALAEAIAADRQAGRMPDARQVQALHASLRRPTLRCTDCHRAEGSLVDLAPLGYPPARVRHLRQAAIFRMIQDIAAGQPFHLPAFIEPSRPGGARPTSRPAP